MRNLRTLFLLCVRLMTYISIMRICTQVVAGECLKGCYICLPCVVFFLFCLLVIYRLSFISLHLQRLFRLFSRVVNARRRRLGWRHRVFVCLLRLSLWINTANRSPITRRLLPLHALSTIHFNLPAPNTFLTEVGGSIVIT